MAKTLSMKRPNTVLVSKMPLKRVGIFWSGVRGMVSVELKSTRAIIITMPGPSILIAVPAMVWSAPRFTVAKAWMAPKSMPARPPQIKPR